MKPLILFILLMSVSGTVYAEKIDCSQMPFRKWTEDYSTCRIANALESIAEALKK